MSQQLSKTVLHLCHSQIFGYDATRETSFDFLASQWVSVQYSSIVAVLDKQAHSAPIKKPS
jgi:hypothetical protein